MIYAKVDVKLRDHERAHRAGAAMATWTWALLYAREQESDGFVPDVALRGAWVGEKQARRDAERLVEVGLWEHADRGYRICRYEAKNDTRETIAARRKETRDRVASFRKGRDVTRYESVTNANVSGAESALVPGSRSLSLSSGSDQGGAGGKRVLRPDEPLNDQRRKDFEGLTSMTGRPRDLDSEWRGFVDNRITNSKLFEGEAAIDADWRVWVRRGNQYASRLPAGNGAARMNGGGASARARKELT